MTITDTELVQLHFSIARTQLNLTGFPRFMLISPQFSEEDGSAPAASIEVWGLDDLKTMRDMLTRLIDKTEARNAKK